MPSSTGLLQEALAELLGDTVLNYLGLLDEFLLPVPSKPRTAFLANHPVSAEADLDEDNWAVASYDANDDAENDRWSALKDASDIANGLPGARAAHREHANNNMTDPLTARTPQQCRKKCKAKKGFRCVRCTDDGRAESNGEAGKRKKKQQKANWGALDLAGLRGENEAPELPDGLPFCDGEKTRSIEVCQILPPFTELGNEQVTVEPMKL